MPEIQRTAQAEEDLIELWIYIAQDNPAAADRVLDVASTSGYCLRTSLFYGRKLSDFISYLAGWNTDCSRHPWCSCFAELILTAASCLKSLINQVSLLSG
jgi:hypothetical protein